MLQCHGREAEPCVTGEAAGWLDRAAMAAHGITASSSLYQNFDEKAVVDDGVKDDCRTKRR
jgi:hypothetical protein